MKTIDDAMQVVPKEPTREMIRAALAAPFIGHPETGGATIPDMYRAMLAAAPPCPTGDEHAAGRDVDARESPWKFVKIRKLDRDNWLVEITGMASAVSSVMSLDPREMLLASLAELIDEHGHPGSAPTTIERINGKHQEATNG